MKIFRITVKEYNSLDEGGCNDESYSVTAPDIKSAIDKVTSHVMRVHGSFRDDDGKVLKWSIKKVVTTKAELESETDF